MTEPHPFYFGAAVAGVLRLFFTSMGLSDPFNNWNGLIIGFFFNFLATLIVIGALLFGTSSSSSKSSDVYIPEAIRADVENGKDAYSKSFHSGMLPLDHLTNETKRYFWLDIYSTRPHTKDEERLRNMLHNWMQTNEQLHQKVHPILERIEKDKRIDEVYKKLYTICHLRLYQGYREAYDEYYNEKWKGRIDARSLRIVVDEFIASPPSSSTWHSVEM